MIAMYWVLPVFCIAVVLTAAAVLCVFKLIKWLFAEYKKSTHDD